MPKRVVVGEAAERYPLRLRHIERRQKVLAWVPAPFAGLLLLWLDRRFRRQAEAEALRILNER